MSAQPVDVLAVMDAEVATLRRLESWVNEALAPTHADAQTAITKMEQARAAVAELIAERDRLQAKLDTNRCNRGHETLPLVLWDCPECHAETKRQLAELTEQYRALIELAESATRSEYEGTSMLDEMLAEIAPYRAALARVQGGAA